MSEAGAETRRVSARAVYRVLQGRSYEQALAGAGHRSLAANQQPLASELALGALRWHHRHAELLRALMDRPRPNSRLQALLSVGLFQLTHTRIPRHAAVSACVSAARELLAPSLAGVVNAVLRRYLRERMRLESTASHSLEGQFSHPGWLIRRLREAWPGHWQAILRSGNRKPPMWLRINRAKTSRESYRETLRASGKWRCAPAAGLPAALRVDPPGPVGQLPGFSEGLASVQDAGAQLAVGLLGARPGMRILDACAAPGGKTAQLLEQCPYAGELVALDADPSRLRRLRANLVRLDLKATVWQGDARRPADWFDGRTFDRILLDAPCSATGVIRRHPDIKHLRREEDIARFAALQAGLLRGLWPLLKPGGRLLYSVCSVLPEETSDVIGTFLGDNRGGAEELSVAGRLPAGWALPLSKHGYQLLPGRRCADGHFNALLQKTSSALSPGTGVSRSR